MSKLIAIVMVAIPVILFLRTVFGRSQLVKQAASDLKRQIDYLVWGILIFIAGAVVYSMVHLMYSAWK